MSVLHAELRRRLWATIVEMNVQFSLDSGMQPLFSTDDFDTLPPANIDDSEIDETTKVAPASKKSTEFTDTSIQITLLKSLPIRLKTIKLINGFRSELSYEETLRLGTGLISACKETSQFLSQSNSPPSSTSYTEHKPTTLQSILLDISIRRFILALHRPFAIKARTDQRYYFSRKLSLDTAMNILYLLSSAPNPNTSLLGGIPSPISQSSPSNTNKGQDELTRLKLCGGTFFKEVILHAAVIILFELIVRIEEEGVGGSKALGGMGGSVFASRTKASREPLRQAIRDLVELCAERIRLGENNVKGHLFMSIALGQIEAMEEGRSVEQGIIEAARVSARVCNAILRARMDERNMNGPIPAVLDDFQVNGGNAEGGMEQDLGFDFTVCSLAEDLLMWEVELIENVDARYGFRFRYG
jgi:hypothetical protein